VLVLKGVERKKNLQRRKNRRYCFVCSRVRQVRGG
jgi:hypothetical protein